MGEDKIDLTAILQKIRKYWWLYATIFPLALLAGWYILQTTLPQYEASLKLLIRDKEESGVISEESLFAELAINKKSKTLENELIVIRSAPIMAEVVKNLELQYQYIRHDGLKKKELYKDSPVRVLDWRPVEEGAGLTGMLQFNGKGGYTIKYPNKSFYGGEFGKELKLPEGVLTLSNEGKVGPDDVIELQIWSVWEAAFNNIANLKVGLETEESSIITLEMQHPNAQAVQDILMELVKVYNQSSIQDKTRVFANTIDMINERVGLLSNELSAAEQSVQSYKQRFNMMELSSEGNLVMTEISGVNKKLAEVDVQLEILNSIERFLKQNAQNFEFVPTNRAINNLTLNSQLETFNQLLSKRELDRSKLGPEHPDLKLAEKQVRNLRQTIIENIGSIKTDLEISKKSDVASMTALETRMQSLPQRERELLRIERQKDLTENLYLYLLQKREEAAISMAVIAPKSATVEPAFKPGGPVKPRKAQILLIAFFLGLALPTGIILLLEMINDKVQNEEDIERSIKVPVLAAIVKSKNKTPLVVKANKNTAIAETFRLLRANLGYSTSGEAPKTVLITSGTSGDGKSFVSLNLGMTVAISDKKVVILELDLRKPKQELYAGLESGVEGVVNYLTNNQMPLHKIIRPSKIHPNLDIITSGPKPPNPSELLLSDRLRQLVAALKEKYDFIIIDAPPVGLVADAFQVKDLPDATLYIVRAGSTRISQLQLIGDIAEKDRLPHPFVVLNGVSVNSNSGYGYGYGYGYGSGKGKGYYHDEEESKKGTTGSKVVKGVKSMINRSK